MCTYIKTEMEDFDPEDSDDIDECWEQFPKMIMRVFTSNSWLFSTIVEKSNQEK